MELYFPYINILAYDVEIFVYPILIVIILLQTLLECVRLRTFSRYGLQQIQVDTHFLKLYLWQYVADEK